MGRGRAWTTGGGWWSERRPVVTSAGRRAVRLLQQPVPDIAVKSLRRVEKALAGACTCGGDECLLVKREIEPEGRPRYWTVWLQCQTCGRGHDGPLSVADHRQWQNYPEWNPALREAWEAARLQKFVVAADQSRLHHVEVLAKQREDYAQWCRSSPEWRRLSDRVLWRSRGWCEACLVERAQTVHHLTYVYGKVPPAWELRAVCRSCHDRLHADMLGGQDEWAPRSMPRVVTADQC